MGRKLWTESTFDLAVKGHVWRRLVPGKLGEREAFKEFYVDALQQAQKRTANDYELTRVRAKAPVSID